MFKNPKFPNQVLPIAVLDFLGVCVHLVLGFVSNFDIRISDLFRYSEQFFAGILNEVKDLL